METQTMLPEIAAVINNSGLEVTISGTLAEKFSPFFEQAAEWKEKAFGLIVTDESQADLMKMAREGRLTLKAIRVDAEKTRKALKEDSLRYGRTVDAIYKVIENVIVPIEQHLEDQEKFKERKEAERCAELTAQRVAVLKAEDLQQYIPVNIALGDIVAEDWEKLLTGARLQQKAAAEAAQAAAKAAEEAAEEKRKLEEQQREERERLRRQLEDQQKLLEAKQAELEAKEKAAAEKEAAEQAALAAPDKEKLQLLLADLRELKAKYQFKSKKFKGIHTAVCKLIDRIITFVNSKF